MLRTRSETLMMCYYCKAYTYTTLLMSCYHYICLSCASNLVADLIQKDSSVVACQICQLKTKLSTELFNKIKAIQDGKIEVDGSNNLTAGITHHLQYRLQDEEKAVLLKAKKLNEVYSAHANRIKHRFELLHKQLENKQNSLLSHLEKSFRYQIGKIYKIKYNIEQERSKFLKIEEAIKSNTSFGIISLSIDKETSISNGYFQLMTQIFEVDVNLKPMHNLVFDIDLKSSSKQDDSSTSVKYERQNMLTRRASDKPQFNRYDSYNRMLEKLNSSMTIIKNSSTVHPKVQAKLKLTPRNAV